MVTKIAAMNKEYLSDWADSDNHGWKLSPEQHANVSNQVIVAFSDFAGKHDLVPDEVIHIMIGTAILMCRDMLQILPDMSSNKEEMDREIRRWVLEEFEMVNQYVKKEFGGQDDAND